MIFGVIRYEDNGHVLGKVLEVVDMKTMKYSSQGVRHHHYPIQ